MRPKHETAKKINHVGHHSGISHGTNDEDCDDVTTALASSSFLTDILTALAKRPMTTHSPLIIEWLGLRAEPTPGCHS